MTTITTDKGLITIADGQTVGTLTLGSNGEDVYLDASSLTATITSATGGNFENLSVAQATATATIGDTIDPVTATLTAGAASFGADGVTITYTVTLSSGTSPFAPTGGAPLTFTLANSGATLVIPDGATTVSKAVFFSYASMAGATTIVNSIGSVTGKEEYESLQTAGQTTTAANTTPSGGGIVNLTLAEAALDLANDNADLQPGKAVGTNPASTAETAANAGITFTTTGEAITVGFAAGQAPVVTGLASGYTIAWSLVGAQLVGTLMQGLTNHGAAIYLSLSGTSAAAGSSVTPVVTATLVDSLEHASGSGSVTINGVSVVATDTSRDTVSGIVNLTVTDDAPVLGAFSPGTIPNETGSITGAFALNAGADGIDHFEITGPAIAGITYTTSVGANGATVLHGYSATANADVFTLTVRPDGTYTYQLVTPNASTSTTQTMTGLSAGGPVPFIEAPGFLVEFASGQGVNSSSQGFGVADQFVEKNETFTMEFHSVATPGDTPTGTDPRLVGQVDFAVTNNSSGSVSWTVTNSATGATQSGTATVVNDHLFIDPNIDFNLLSISGNQGAKVRFSSANYTQNVLPQDSNLAFDIKAVDGDNDASAIHTLSIHQVANASNGTFSLTGTAADDTIAASTHADTITGNAGFDIVDYSDSTSAISINLGATGNASVAPASMSAPADGQIGGGHATGDTLTGIEGIRGGHGNDVLSGNASVNALYGNDGADRLVGEGGNDILTGGDGDDILIGGLGSDTLTGGNGADTFVFDSFDAADLIADYGTGDKIDLTALFEDAGPINTADYVHYDSTTGVLQVDANGAMGGSNFSTVATVATDVGGHPTQITILFDDGTANPHTAILI